MESLGMITIRSGWQGHFLQAHRESKLADTGEMHCSRNTASVEETFFLFEIDKGKRIYAIHTFESDNQEGGFLSVLPNGCARANAVLVTDATQFTFVSGKDFGILNAVAIRSVKTGHYLGTNAPGDDIHDCGGEVGCGINAPGGAPVGPTRDHLYHGWWILTPRAKAPSDPDVLAIAGTIVKVVEVAASVISTIAG